MSVNQAVIASLLKRPVPPDRECVSTLSDILQGAQDFMQVVGLASQIASPTGVSVPVTNNTGQQALNLAQTLQVLVNELQAEQTQRRTAAVNTGVPTGNSEVPFTFDPAMPSAQYEVRAYFTTTVSHTTVPKWRVASGSVSTTGFTLILDDVPASSLITVLVEEIKQVT